MTNKFLSAVEDSIKYLKFNPKLLIPDTLLFFTPLVASFIFLIINKLIPFGDISLTNLTTYVPTAFQTIFSSTAGTISFIISFLIILVISVFLGISLISARFLMIKAATYGEKINFLKAFKYGSHYIYKLFWIELILTLIYLITFGIIFLIGFTGGLIGIILAILLFILIMILYSFLFLFAIPELYYKKIKNPFTIIGNSARFTKNNLTFVFFTIVTLLILKIIASSINQALTTIFGISLIATIPWLGWILVGIISLIVSVIFKVWRAGFLFTIYKKERKI